MWPRGLGSIRLLPPAAGVQAGPGATQSTATQGGPSWFSHANCWLSFNTVSEESGPRWPWLTPLPLSKWKPVCWMFRCHTTGGVSAFRPGLGQAIRLTGNWGFSLSPSLLSGRFSVWNALPYGVGWKHSYHSPIIRVYLITITMKSSHLYL